MKKNAISILILAITVVEMASCGKSTKGKMTNEWKVTSMKSVETYINPNGDKHIDNFSVEGTTITETDDYYPVSAPSYSTSRTGTMTTNEFTIKKDGTWTWVMNGTYPGSNANSSLTQQVEQAGTWSFLNKSKGDDFKKNERVIFNELTAKIHEIEIENGVVVDDDTDDLVYSTGMNTMIYTVKDSKKNKLEFELESHHVYTQTSIQGSNATSQTIVLESK